LLLAELETERTCDPQENCMMTLKIIGVAKDYEILEGGTNGLNA